MPLFQGCVRRVGESETLDVGSEISTPLTLAQHEGSTVSDPMSEGPRKSAPWPLGPQKGTERSTWQKPARDWGRGLPVSWGEWSAGSCRLPEPHSPSICGRRLGAPPLGVDGWGIIRGAMDSMTSAGT